MAELQWYEDTASTPHRLVVYYSDSDLPPRHTGSIRGYTYGRTLTPYLKTSPLGMPALGMPAVRAGTIALDSVPVVESNAYAGFYRTTTPAYAPTYRIYDLIDAPYFYTAPSGIKTVTADTAWRIESALMSLFMPVEINATKQSLLGQYIYPAPMAMWSHTDYYGAFMSNSDMSTTGDWARLLTPITHPMQSVVIQRGSGSPERADVVYGRAIDDGSAFNDSQIIITQNDPQEIFATAPVGYSALWYSNVPGIFHLAFGMPPDGVFIATASVSTGSPAPTYRYRLRMWTINDDPGSPSFDTNIETGSMTKYLTYIGYDYYSIGPSTKSLSSYSASGYFYCSLTCETNSGSGWTTANGAAHRKIPCAWPTTAISGNEDRVVPFMPAPILKIGSV